jgi:hypothetical protein
VIRGLGGCRRELEKTGDRQRRPAGGDVCCLQDIGLLRIAAARRRACESRRGRGDGNVAPVAGSLQERDGWRDPAYRDGSDISILGKA